MDPIENESTPLPRFAWIGGHLTITDEAINFHGSTKVPTNQPSGRSIHHSFSVPLARVAAAAVRRGLIGVRYITIDIDDGSQLQLRPTKLDDTFAHLQAALSK